MTTEVAIVDWLMKRRNIGMVLADSLFWLFIGMPLVYLFTTSSCTSPSATPRLS